MNSHFFQVSLSAFRAVQIPIAAFALLCGGAGTASAEPLKDRLDGLREGFIKASPADKVKSYQDGIDHVAASGIYERALKTGGKAPDFTLPNAEGEPRQLSELLKKGPVVLTWYRGGWCPYCNLALAALAEKMPEIKAAGGQLVALTPELPSHAEETTLKNKLNYEVLSDVGNRVARDYGVVFKMTPDVAEAMQKFAKLHERNGDASDELPLSATYVISTDGTVSYAFLDADYRNRAEPARIVDALEALQSGKATNEHLLLQFWEGVWNPPYDVALVDRLMTEDFVLTTAGTEVKGREAFKQWIKTLQSQAADLRLTNRDLFSSADGTRVVSRWMATGRNRGMFGTAADDQAVEFTGIAVWEVRDGKLAHNWVERSAYELSMKLRQKEE
jgi:peroxiredoxin/predicted ester cyclase